MKKKLILKILVGALVVAGAVGTGVVIGRVSNKEQPQETNVSEPKETGDTQTNNSDIENKVDKNSKDTSTSPKSEDVTKPSAINSKAPATNNEKSKVEENTIIKNENKDTGTTKEEPSNGVYKAGISQERLKEVKDKYYANMSDVSVEFGRHFIKTGDLLFSDDKLENESHKKLFYNVMDKNLNELWSDLKTILSDAEMKKLTQEQLQWIKQKDSINKEGTEIATAETNTIYARGKETYKRWMYLGDKYLNY